MKTVNLIRENGQVKVQTPYNSEFEKRANENDYETCTLVVKNTNKGGDDSIELFGRTILRAFGRKSEVQLGEDIIWISGVKKTTGSEKNWGVIIVNGTFEIQNFPLERTKFNDVQKAIQEGWCEIKVTETITETKRSREEILAEISALEEKLANLKAELNNL